MAALSALAAYGDSDSGEEVEEKEKDKPLKKHIPKTHLVLHEKDKTGKVKIYLPQITSSHSSSLESEVSTIPSLKDLFLFRVTKNIKLLPALQRYVVELCGRKVGH